MPNLVLALTDHAAYLGHQLFCNMPTLILWQYVMHSTIKGRLTAYLFIQPTDGSVDDFKRYGIAFVCGIGPGEQAVATQHNASCLGVILTEFTQP